MIWYDFNEYQFMMAWKKAQEVRVIHFFQTKEVLSFEDAAMASLQNGTITLSEYITLIKK